MVGLALILSACNAHALRQKLVSAPASEPISDHIRMQFDCTENGLYIFEGFPDIVRAHPIMVNDNRAQASADKLTKNSAGRSSECLVQLD